jgi:hypothetical protein
LLVYFLFVHFLFSHVLFSHILNPGSLISCVRFEPREIAAI